MEKAFQKNANPKKAGIAIIYLTKQSLSKI